MPITGHEFEYMEKPLAPSIFCLDPVARDDHLDPPDDEPEEDPEEKYLRNGDESYDALDLDEVDDMYGGILED